MTASAGIPLTDGDWHLREVRAGDLPALVEMLSDARQVRFIEWEATEASAKTLLDWSLRTAAETPRTAYALALTGSDDAALGVCSLVLREPPLPSGRLGIVLLRRMQGKGIALRASRLLIRFGFEQLELPCLTASCDARNVASVRLLERLGMRREERLHSPAEQEAENDKYRYVLLKDEWKAVEGVRTGKPA